jgi:hypothetical protein
MFRFVGGWGEFFMPRATGCVPAGASWGSHQGFHTDALTVTREQVDVSEFCMLLPSKLHAEITS